MNSDIRGVLEAFLKMSNALSSELMRLSKNDQFNDTPECIQLIESLRGSYMEGLQNLRTIEHRIMARGLIPPPTAADSVFE